MCLMFTAALLSISDYSPLVPPTLVWMETSYVSLCHRFDYTTEMWLDANHLEWPVWLGCEEKMFQFEAKKVELLGNSFNMAAVTNTYSVPVKYHLGII